MGFGGIRYKLRFKLFSFSSINWLREAFYPEGIKIIPRDLVNELFTPLSLAILIMDDGTKVSAGLRFCLQGFVYEDVKWFAEFLTLHYNISTSLHGSNDQRTQWYIYIKKESVPWTRELVAPYIIESMYYKIKELFYSQY